VRQEPAQRRRAAEPEREGNPPEASARRPSELDDTADPIRRDQRRAEAEEAAERRGHEVSGFDAEAVEEVHNQRVAERNQVLDTPDRPVEWVAKPGARAI
jgi:predicted kinase